MSDEKAAVPTKAERASFSEGYQWGVKYGAATKRGFMCKIDFEHELGAALGGNKIYPSARDLRKEHKMTDECGIVEVEVRLVRVVKYEAHTIRPRPKPVHRAKATTP